MMEIIDFAKMALKDEKLTELLQFEKIYIKNVYKKELLKLMRLEKYDIKTLKKNKFINYMIKYYSVLDNFNIIDTDNSEEWPFSITLDSINNGLMINTQIEMKLFLVNSITFSEVWLKLCNNLYFVELIQNLYHCSADITVLITNGNMNLNDDEIGKYFNKYEKEIQKISKNVKMTYDGFLDNTDKNEEQKTEIKNTLSNLLSDVEHITPSKENGALDQQQLLHDLLFDKKSKINNFVEDKLKKLKKTKNYKEADSLLDILDVSIQNTAAKEKMSENNNMQHILKNFNKDKNKMRQMLNSSRMSGKKGKIARKFMRIMDNIS